MSETASPAGATDEADHNKIMEAALKRLDQLKPQSEDESAELRYEQERPIRQKFRRLVDPGIVRNNNDADAKKTFEILSKLSQNLLSDPENPKFREFKSTNATIQRALIKTIGGIEYAIEMGFRATVDNFQPKYVWHSSPENLVLLRVGADVIREHNELASAKDERSSKSKQTVAEEKAAAVRNAQLAFEDDRKTRKLLDARMKSQPPMSPMRVAPQAPTSPTFRTQSPGEKLLGATPRRGYANENEDTIVDGTKPDSDD